MLSSSAVSRIDSTELLRHRRIKAFCQCSLGKGKSAKASFFWSFPAYLRLILNHQS
jgi:hypothetical protein